MNSRQITSLVLFISSIGFGSGCSDGAVAGRLPVNSGGNGAGGGGTGGKANSGGSGGSATGGKSASGGSGGAVGGATTGGMGGAATAVGGGLNLSNCDTATLAMLFKLKKCGECHFAATAFDMVTALNSWVGKMGIKTATMNCPNRTMIVPGSPQASLLYIKLAGVPPAECGAQMPKSAAKDAFAPAELKCVEDWINALPAGTTGGGSGI